MRTADGGNFNWWLPACGAFGAVILLLPTLIWGNDAGAFFLFIPLSVIIILILIIISWRTLRRHSLAVVAMICIFLLLASSLHRSSDYLRTTTRWLIHSQSYKREVLGRPTASDGNLEHIEWDAWGFPGVGDTFVYLVNDPTDGLEEAAKKGLPGKFQGLPCQVVRVRRLEDYWYTVLFYTETDWNDCAP